MPTQARPWHWSFSVHGFRSSQAPLRGRIDDAVVAQAADERARHFSVPPVHAKVPVKAVLVEFAVAPTDRAAQRGALAPLAVNTPVPVSTRAGRACP